MFNGGGRMGRVGAEHGEITHSGLQMTGSDHGETQGAIFPRTPLQALVGLKEEGVSRILGCKNFMIICELCFPILPKATIDILPTEIHCGVMRLGVKTRISWRTLLFHFRRRMVRYKSCIGPHLATLLHSMDHGDKN